MEREMAIRISKILLLASLAIYCLLSALSNINDFQTTLQSVKHVFMMDSLMPQTSITYRALTSPALHYTGLIFILSLEILTGILCGLGAYKLFRVRNKDAMLFNHTKKTAIIGLTLGFLTWQVIFMSIGGEWFGMWMNPLFNNVLTAAFHIFITFLVLLIYVSRNDE
jgi:predicted small integral membrane protein